MDKLELSRQIRFALNDLSARNGHHQFEELCRYLVAARIATNVYPATGPVAAGGDAGRDFQTFATQIREELGPHGGFAALVATEPTAFACSLQAKALPSKIRKDVAKIVAHGPPVSRVYALLGSDLDSSKVASLKTELAKEHGISLEVLDGQALAELLTDHDTFWIAARWLAIPAEYAPERPSDQADEPDWYVETRLRWQQAEGHPRSMGEVMDLAGWPSSRAEVPPRPARHRHVVAKNLRDRTRRTVLADGATAGSVRVGCVPAAGHWRSASG